MPVSAAAESDSKAAERGNLAASHIDNKELVKEYLRKIGTSSEHLISLINDVLDMSRIESAVQAGMTGYLAKPIQIEKMLKVIGSIL